MATEAKPTVKNVRLRAFLIHLAISIVIMLVLLGIIFFAWYPREFILAGGMEGLLILAGVDLVIGPLLTLIIYNPRKRAILIRLDLTLIALAQAACIVYGLSLIYPQRPLLQVLADDGVHIYTAAELEIHRMDVQALGLPGDTPHNVVLDIPSHPAAINQLKLVHEIINGKPFALSEELYVPAEDYGAGAMAQRLELIRSRARPATRTFIETLESVPGCTWLPIHSIHTRGAGCYSPEKGLLNIARR